MHVISCCMFCLSRLNRHLTDKHFPIFYHGIVCSDGMCGCIETSRWYNSMIQDNTSLQCKVTLNGEHALSKMVVYRSKTTVLKCKRYIYYMRVLVYGLITSVFYNNVTSLLIINVMVYLPGIYIYVLLFTCLIYACFSLI